MPLTSDQQAALDRLLNFYDGEFPYDPSTNPGGLRRGGHVPNFEPILDDIAAVANGVGGLSEEVDAIVAEALAAYGNSSALTTAVQQAQTSATQAQNAVGTGRVLKTTLALLNADLAYPDGAQAEVLGDGANDGLYSKIGASGTGSWVKRSNATVTSLAATQVSLQSVNDEWAAGHLLPIRDSANKLLASILESGDFLIGDMLHANYDDDSYVSNFYQPVIAKKSGGNRLAGIETGDLVLGGYDPKTGYFKTVLDPLTLILSDGIANLDTSLIYTLGGRGTIYRVRKQIGDFYRYISDAPDAALPILSRSDKVARAHMLDTTSDILIRAGYGQSWRVLEYPTIGLLIKDADPEPEAALTLHVTNPSVGGLGEPMAVSAGINYPGGVDDLCGLSVTSNVNIDRAAAIARARHRRRLRLRQRPEAHYCFAYPGSTWTSGGDDGLGLQTTGTTWARGALALADTKTWIGYYGKTWVARSLSWTQGGNGNVDYATNIAQLGELRTAITAAGFEHLYMGIRGQNSGDTTTPDSTLAQIAYARANTASKVWVTYPWYPLGLASTAEGDPGNIHWTGAGTVTYAEMEALVQIYVEELGLTWNPLWLSRAAGAITRSGQTITVRFERPPGTDWLGAPLAIDHTRLDPALNDGFRVRRSGVDLTVGARTITTVDGLPAITFPITEALTTGDVLEVSYAIYGPGSPVLTHAGVWGNVVMRGPPSLVAKDFPTVDCPLVPFKESITL